MQSLGNMFRWNLNIKKKYFRSRKTMHLKISCAKWRPDCIGYKVLTHWGQVMYTGVGNLTIISSDNGLSPGRCQVIIWTNAGILLIGPLGTNFGEILIEIQKTFLSTKKFTNTSTHIIYSTPYIPHTYECVEQYTLTPYIKVSKRPTLNAEKPSAAVAL